MAEAFAKRLSRGAVDVESAGTMPSDAVNPVFMQAMQEKGTDLSDSTPKLLTQEMADRADLVITMGCSIDEACPAAFVPSEDWGIEDPEGQPLERVRRIRDQVESNVQLLPARFDGAR